MPSSLVRRGGVAALLALALVSPFGALGAQAAEEDEGAPPDGAIEIPYGETGEIRPAPGWIIDCAGLAPFEGATLTCEAEGITLSVDAYDPEWGERPLAVPMMSRFADLTVVHTVRLGLPPAPEQAVERFDMPVAVGEQAMIPLVALGITCAVCTAEGGATLEVGKLPAGVWAGLSETHLSVRASTPGDIAIPLRMTDDAGQQTTAEFTVSFIDGDAAATPGALHLVSPASEWNLAELSWGKELRILCTEPRPAGLACGPDGVATLAEAAAPAQFLFRVVDAEGGLGWGSVTRDSSAGEDRPAAPVWADEAPLQLVLPPAGENTEDTSESPFGPLPLLLEGMSGS